MHHIDRTSWNHNSLSPGDLNGDGFTDYAVIHEGPDLYTFVLHPGRHGDVRKPWPKVILSGGANVEYSIVGDFDGDGNLDIAGAEGDSEKGSAGIRILWGPGTARVTDPKAWTASELIPSTLDRGHWLYVEACDINGDGLADVVAASRRLARNGALAGIVWLEAPRDPKLRRDVSGWRMHPIAPLAAGGHGFIFADIDGDGDADIVDADVDWDTTYNDKRILWLENPGPAAASLRQPWREHIIYRQAWEIFPKAQVDAADFNGDGRLDVAIQTNTHIYLFEQTPQGWKRKPILKPGIAQWVPRPLKAADLNGDGKPDIVGALIHDVGYLPPGKAAVFWMDASDWSTRVIKWSDGSNTNSKGRGEKWDHIRFADVDGDGDLDIVANAEEHYDEKRNSYLGVVWFENPLKP